MTHRFAWRIRRPALLGLFTGVAAACAAETGQQRADAGETVQRDSAGVFIVETPGATARADIGWRVDEFPELQLGSAIGEGPETFHRIGGIRGLPDGGTVVVDGGSGELRFFDRTGHFRNRTGRLGDGPGEFRIPRLVPYPADDSLLVFDTRHRRFTLFSSDGRAYRNFPDHDLPRNIVTGMPRGANARGVAMTAMLGTLVMGQTGPGSDPVGVRWINTASGEAEIVAQGETLSYTTNDLGDLPYTLTVPFSARPVAAVGRGGFFVTAGPAPEVHEFDNDRRLSRILRLVEEPRPVTRADAEAVIEFEAARFNRVTQARHVYQQMQFPQHWPAFQALHVDRLGWLWAELYRTGESTPLWLIFDPDGTARGTLDVPRDLDIHDIGDDYILGQTRDDLGVEHVRRYRLHREN